MIEWYFHSSVRVNDRRVNDRILHWTLTNEWPEINQISIQHKMDYGNGKRTLDSINFFTRSSEINKVLQVKSQPDVS
jgi:hypothetical protein